MIRALPAPAAPRPHYVALALRGTGALVLLGVGVDHLQQYSVDHYSAIPTIGTLFALNFVAATIVGLSLLAPIERLLARRRARLVLTALALAGVGIAGGSLAGLLISEQWGLFGFMEAGYRWAIVVSIVLEATTILLLGGFVAALRRRHAWLSP